MYVKKGQKVNFDPLGLFIFGEDECSLLPVERSLSGAGYSTAFKSKFPTYLSAVHVTEIKTTYFIESVYSKLQLS